MRGEESQFPQNRGTSSNWNFQEVYWKCALVFFTTASAYHPNSRLVLFLNRPPRDSAEYYVDWLKRMSVEIIVLEFGTRPPAGFSYRFGNQFYIFDIINYIAARPQSGGWYVLDSDCVFVKQYDLVRALTEQKHEMLTYAMGYSQNHNINGVTRLQLGQIAMEEGWSETCEPIVYCGGEFFAASAAQLAIDKKIFEETRIRCVERWSAGLLSPTEEAHVLSLAYVRLGVRAGTANRLIRRIWTSFKFRDVMIADTELAIWHLPAEKRTGLSRLYNQLKIRNHSEKAVSQSYLYNAIRETCGVPRRSLWKIGLDFFQKLDEKIRL